MTNVLDHVCQFWPPSWSNCPKMMKSNSFSDNRSIHFGFESQNILKSDLKIVLFFFLFFFNCLMTDVLDHVCQFWPPNGSNCPKIGKSSTL